MRKYGRATAPDGDVDELDDVDHDDHACSQLFPQLTDQDRPALPYLVELCLKTPYEGARLTVSCELQVLLATDIELDKCPAHLLFTNPEICDHTRKPEKAVFGVGFRRNPF